MTCKHVMMMMMMMMIMMTMWINNQYSSLEYDFCKWTPVVCPKIRGSNNVFTCHIWANCWIVIIYISLESSSLPEHEYLYVKGVGGGGGGLCQNWAFTATFTWLYT